MQIFSEKCVFLIHWPHYNFSFGTEVDAVDCNAEPKTTEGRLRKKLLCGYDKSSRPTLNEGPIMIKMKMIIKGFDFDDYGGKLTVSTWLAMVSIPPHKSFL